MSLYENINRRRKLGVSRSKKDSTISKGSYSDMKKGFPEKANEGKLMTKKRPQTSKEIEAHNNLLAKQKPSKNDAETILDKYPGKTYKNMFDARKASDNEDAQNYKEQKAVDLDRDPLTYNHGGEVRGGGAAIRGLGFKGVF